VQYFFQKQALDDVEVIRFVIDHLFAPHETVMLAIDRTDWAFGQTRHNLLCISVLHQETAIPLITLPLERKGNSDRRQREALIGALLSALPARRIKALLGDREFIGDDWFTLLLEKKVPFVMRVKNNMIIATDEKIGAIHRLCPESVPKDYGAVHIGTHLLHLQTTRSRDQLVAVIASGVENPLALYKKRWAIETGFKCLKTGGFNLEDTHLVHSQRIKTLVQICSLAMTLSFIALDYAKATAPNAKKNTAINSSPPSPLQDASS
jgi:hypothetical protein